MQERPAVARISPMLAYLCAVSIACAVVAPIPAKAGAPFTRVDLDRLNAEWPARDGAAGIAMSDHLCQFVLHDSALLLDYMVDHREFFDEWLAAIKNLSFVDRGDCIDRECMRVRMMGAVGAAQLQPQSRALGDRLVARLREITVRAVD